MEKANEKDNKQAENLSASDKKRTFVNVAVTAEEKIAITKAAVTDRGISVSEYCRTQIFKPNQEQNTETILDVLTDDEKEIYIKKVEDQSEQLRLVNAENAKLKADKSTPTQSEEYKTLKAEYDKLKEGILVSPNDVFLGLTPEERKMIDLAIEYERACRGRDGYKNMDRFIGQKILNILEENKKYFSEDYKQQGTLENKTCIKLYAKLRGETISEDQEEEEK